MCCCQSLCSLWNRTVMDIKIGSSNGNAINSPESNIPPGIKSSLLPPLLQEYETFITSLQEEVNFYKTEHESLRKDLSDLIIENKSLSDKLKEVLSNKLTKETILSPRHRKESDMVVNLQQQLSLTTQEKDSAVEMWHLAIREVDSLEDELKSYQDNRHVDLVQKKMEDMKKDFSNAVTMLESKLVSTRSSLTKEKAEREKLQTELDKIKQDNAILTETLQSRQQELEASLEGHCTTARKLQEVENTVTELQKQVNTLKGAENELELALTLCHERIDELVRKNLEAREKVSESLLLVECALAEKDAALFKEAQIREENIQLQKVMGGIVDEAGERVKEEVGNLKQHYNRKLKVLLIDMKKLENECKEKEKHLQKEIKEKCFMEGELEKIQKDSPVVTSMLEKKMTMAYNEVSDLKRDNMQLNIQKENLHSELERIKESHTVEIRKMNIERQIMEEQILGLQAQLQATVRIKNEDSEHIGRLEEHIKVLEQELEKRQLMSAKELRDLHLHQQYQNEHQVLVSQIKEIKEKSNATASELEHHLEKQHIMKTKYQKAMKTMTEKFEIRIQELHSEASILRKKNKELESQLHNLQAKLVDHRQSEKDEPG